MENIQLLLSLVAVEQWVLCDDEDVVVDVIKSSGHRVMIYVTRPPKLQASHHTRSSSHAALTLLGNY